MDRRRFLSSSLGVAGASALASGASAQSPAATSPEYYELRQYHLRVTMRQRFSDHYRDEALPAYNRAGISPIGVFTVAFGPDSPTRSSRPTRSTGRRFWGCRRATPATCGSTPSSWSRFQAYRNWRSPLVR
jgi:hypothetical protein